MSEIVPRLDTIEFDQLVEQARGDIPRYAPDWTDHNLHDPGMTVIDLLAWIVDQQVYRCGFVGGRHHRAFAALLGQRAEDPKPARGLVWPTSAVSEGRFVAAGTDVICRQHRDLGFVLDWPDDIDGAVPDQRSIYCPPATLTGVRLAADGVELPALTPGVGGGSWALGKGRLRAGTTLSFRLDGPLGSPASAASVSLGIEVAPPPGPPLARGDRPWGPVVFSYRVGGSAWVRLRVLHDGTAGLAGTGTILLALPQAEPAEAGGSELRLSLDGGFYPVPPQIRDAAINVLPVVQRTVSVSGRLGIGTGQPDQMVELDSGDLVSPPSRPRGPVLEIEVEQERWEERPDFSRSGPDDPHFVVGPGHLLFGNGVNGRRPDPGAQITHTGLARTAGAVGNVRQGLSWSVPVLRSEAAEFGRNRHPLTGGADRSGVDDLATATRDAAVRRSALLTDDELRSAAHGLTGLAVGRAEVLAGFDRRLGERRVDGVRTLVVLPWQPSASDGGGPPDLIQASPAYLDEVAARLAPRRVLGERLVVQGPVAVPVDLWLTATVDPGTPADDVEGRVARALRDRLSSVRRSAAVDPWPLGRDLTTCELEAIAANVPGVAAVALVQVARAGEPAGGGPIRMPPDGLIVAHEIMVVAQTADDGTGCGPSRSVGGGGRAR